MEISRGAEPMAARVHRGASFSDEIVRFGPGPAAPPAAALYSFPERYDPQPHLY